MPDVRLVSSPYEAKEGEMVRMADGSLYVGLANRQYILIEGTRVVGRSTVQAVTNNTTVINNTTTGIDLSGKSGVLRVSGGTLYGNATTSDVPEGTNLYFTDTRAYTAAKAMLAASGIRIVTDDMAETITLYGLGDMAIYANGVEDKTKFAITYSDSTRKFTTTISSGAAIWVGGTRYTPAAGATDSTAHADTTGQYWLVYTASGLSVVTSANVNFQTMAPLAYVYYNATTNLAVLFDERHPDSWPWHIHQYEHIHEGSVYVSGGTIADYTLDTNGDTATTFSIEALVMDDESYRHTLALLADGGPYTIWNRTGTDAAGEWSWSVANTVPYLHDGDDPYYNQLTGGSWKQTVVSTPNRWVNYWLVGTNAYNDAGDQYKHRFALVQGQAVHTTLAAAQNDSFLSAISWGSMPFKEVVPMYKITLRRVSDVGEKNVQIEEVTRIIDTQVSLISTTSPTLHGSLSGRDALGQHPSYAITVDTLAAAPGTVTDGYLFIDESTPTDRVLKLGVGGTWLTVRHLDRSYLMKE